MRGIIIQVVVALLLISIALAADVSQPVTGVLPPDLSNFPDMFVKDGNFNAVIVVGDKAPASDVIAQSNLVQFFGGYLGKSLIGDTKLSSEIGSLNQNIISIGSPCHNPTSAEIMGNPNKCDNWLEPGKAIVIMYGYRDYAHMVIEGYTDKGTRDAVEYLVKQKKGSLSSSSILIDVEETKPEINESGMKEKIEGKNEENITADIEIEKEKLIFQLNEKIASKSADSSKKIIPEIKPSINKTKEKEASGQKQEIKAEQQEQKKETSAIKRMINWFVSLFK
ncbi:hypothetical protein HYV80_07240 [Candidatus Woesearchaeota archaeon]|nr:hypothetical protein [Candidatus Woesearchaeota archaeon]